MYINENNSEGTISDIEIIEKIIHFYYENITPTFTKLNINVFGKESKELLKGRPGESKIKNFLEKHDKFFNIEKEGDIYYLTLKNFDKSFIKIKDLDFIKTIVIYLIKHEHVADLSVMGPFFKKEMNGKGSLSKLLLKHKEIFNILSKENKTYVILKTENLYKYNIGSDCV